MSQTTAVLLRAALLGARALDEDLTAEERALLSAFEYGDAPPLSREECATWVTPCRLTQCRFHLAHERAHGARLTGDREIPDDEWCALNVAERGNHNLDQIGAMLGTTREAIRQIETNGIIKLKRKVKSLPIWPDQRSNWTTVEE